MAKITRICYTSIRSEPADIVSSLCTDQAQTVDGYYDCLTGWRIAAVMVRPGRDGDQEQFYSLMFNCDEGKGLVHIIK